MYFLCFYVIKAVILFLQAVQTGKNNVYNNVRKSRNSFKSFLLDMLTCKSLMTTLYEEPLLLNIRQVKSHCLVSSRQC